MSTVIEHTANASTYHDVLAVLAEHSYGHPTVQYVLLKFEREPNLVIALGVMAAVVLFLLYLLQRKAYDPALQAKLTPQEEEALLAEWKQSVMPLTPVLEDRVAKRNVPLVESVSGAYVKVAGREYLNLASMNFLGMATQPTVKEESRKAIEKYGVGSCGPRGFYGSLDVHINLEQWLAKFLGTSQTILFSDSFSTCASVIPAFLKKGDLLVCDEGVNFSLQTGMSLSRATIKYFKHNDMKDLQKVLDEVEKQTKDPKYWLKHRRFIVVEGIYQNYGDLCPLSTVIQLKKQYKYRVVLDDSLGFGVLGESGRGSVEHWGVQMSDVEFYCAGLDNAVCSIGGFCAGSDEVVDHQRLSAAGYCFSAAAPPYTSSASIAALEVLKAKPEMCEILRSKASRLRRALSTIPGVELRGEEISPVLHLRLEKPLASVKEEFMLMDQIYNELWSQGVAVTVSEYTQNERRPPRPSLRVSVSVLHSDLDIDRAADLIKLQFRLRKL